ncbi:MAG: C-terminal binding protein [Litorilinea sp.]
MAHETTVLVTDYAWPDLAQEQAVLPHARLVVAHADDAQMAQQAVEADAILTCWRSVPPAVLDAARQCKIVARYGIGLDNIPVAHATGLGMLVTNVPDFCLDEVSDHALGLILACARKLVAYAQATQAGVWDLQAGPPMRRLRGQTLGLIGYGNIAQRLAIKARALGMEILAYTPRLAPGVLMPDDPVPWGRATNDLHELLAAADYVSLHVPLNDETRGMIDRAALRSMKPTAYLINTARGAVVDEVALATALAAGTLAGAALDVLSQEPPPADHPLLAMPQVIATPHAAFVSQEATAELIYKAATNVAQVLHGQVPQSLVNLAVLSQANCRLDTTTRAGRAFDGEMHGGSGRGGL